MTPEELDIATQNLVNVIMEDNSYPLKWWKAKEEQYELLAAVVKALYSIPSNSISASFSLAKLIKTKARNRLSDDAFDSVLTYAQELKNKKRKREQISSKSLKKQRLTKQ